VRFDPQTLSPAAMYRFMISVVVPRPIAFISTHDEEGRLNLAPFSYFMPITNRPPLVGMSIQSRAGALKDTARNIERTSEFVINVAT
jgi:flavin reductase (DIM6/NTAB) family NADH-FMN oxidoreductase RutF